MESSSYPMLFSPIKVGTTEVKNRVFMPPVSTNLADHGYVTDVWSIITAPVPRAAWV
mgnify:CR=1 FL=1